QPQRAGGRRADRRAGAGLHRRRLPRLPEHPGPDEGGRARDHRPVLSGLLRRLLPGAGAPAAGDGQDAVRAHAFVTEPRLSYAEAGVDVEGYDRILAGMKAAIEATHGPKVVAGVGPFAGVYALPSGGRLAASTDSVGTKVKVAIAGGRHD